MAYSSNTLLTPTIVANEALAILQNNNVYSKLVHTDYSKEFVNAVGDTVNVRTPATLTAYEFSSSITTQDTTEASVPVKLNHFADVSVVLTAKDWTLKIKDFAQQIIAPAMVAISQKVDADIALALFSGAGTTVTESTSTITTLATLANVSKALDVAKAPNMDRNLVMSPYHKYRYGIIDNLAKGSYAGDVNMLRRNELGPVFGMATYMDQNTPTSTATTSGTSIGTMSIASSGTANEIDITLLSGATSTVVVGDGFVYDGILYRLTEIATGTTNEAPGITTSPVFPESVAATSVTIIRNGTSLAFNKDAIAFVNRPLAVPQGAARAAVAAADGLSVRVVFDYASSTKQDTISFDILYGIKMLRATLAVRLVDGTLS